jgi:hypothetical protein
MGGEKLAKWVLLMDGVWGFVHGDESFLIEFDGF